MATARTVKPLNWAWVYPPEWDPGPVSGDLVPGPSGRIPFSVAPALRVAEDQEVLLSISNGNRRSIEAADYIRASHHPIISERLFSIIKAECNIGSAQFVPVKIINKDFSIPGFGFFAVYDRSYVIDIEKSKITRSFNEGNKTAILGFESICFFDKVLNVDFTRDDRLYTLLLLSSHAKSILEKNCRTKLYFLRDVEVPSRRW